MNGKEIAIETIRSEDFAWLAGIIDGEGNINVGFYGNGKENGSNGQTYKVFRMSVAITNTHADMIEKATQILSELGIFYKVSLRKRNPNERPCFSLFINGQKNTFKLLVKVWPYLTSKKEIATQAIEAYERRLSLIRAGNNQFCQDEPRVQDDAILNAMIDRARELVNWRPNPMSYSLVASQPIIVKKRSTTLRLTALKNADDKVCSA
jgi:hypothetical protein